MKSHFVFFLYVIFCNSLIYPTKVINPTVNDKNCNYAANLGNCIDNLRQDIRIFPYKSLNWNIYTDDLEFVEPGGITTYGIDRYKQNLSLLRLFRNVIGSEVTVKYRLRYDMNYRKIIITWYSVWQTNFIPTYIDAVSTFYLNDEAFIYKHTVDRIQTNKNNLWTELSEQILYGQNTPQLSPYDTFLIDETPLNGFLVDTCEYIWDCEAPDEDCCDFVLFKTCCTNGLGMPINPQPEPIPIPIPIEPRRPEVFNTLKAR
tara:strand:+ start:1907 stop:2683 length:777 start_codon:yes stop_codon:yes gene_type:complete